MEYVKIPRSRVGVLIGREGNIKKEIEALLKVRLKVDAKDGVVTIENFGDDPLAEWKARDMVRAIAKGINPKKAEQLARDEYIFEMIDLRDLLGKSRKVMKRQKGRIIGRKGKTREYIEEMSGCAISISGKSVVIIGTFEEVKIAKEGIKMLVSGIPHGVVYKVLQKRNSELKMKRLSLWK